MLSIVFAVSIGLGLIMSSAFIPSPVAIFVDYLNEYDKFSEIFSYVIYFFPVTKALYFLGLWIDVYIATLVTFVIMKIAKII